MLVSQHDNRTPLAFTAKVLSDRQVVDERIVNSKDPWTTKKFPPGIYTIRIFPETGRTHHDYRNVGIGDAFTKSFSLASSETILVWALVTRKESIIYDIPYEFVVGGNVTATASAPLVEISAFSAVSENADYVRSSSAKFAVPESLVKSIMYLETTHGWYDAPLNWMEVNKSIRPMNVNAAYWNELFLRDYLNDVQNNVDAGTFLLKRILERVPSREIAKVATLYNTINAQSVNDYGARVALIHRNSLYIPAPGFFDRISQDINSFESLGPVEQIRILQRMFGR